MMEADEEILTELAVRKITEARHFTTSRGLLGVLGSGCVLSRSQLAEDELVRLLAMNNCYRRWDSAWFDHVSLSVQRINGHLYGISSGSWHAGDQDLWWAVLGFDATLLAQPGVVFATTNNAYSVVRRSAGAEGFRALFADQVTTWQNGAHVLTRAAHTPCQTTCPQAEALYPQAVDTSWLRTIYVPQPELADTVEGWFAATGHKAVEVVFDPGVFT